jgi:hypothetical protein
MQVNFFFMAFACMFFSQFMKQLLVLILLAQGLRSTAPKPPKPSVTVEDLDTLAISHPSVLTEALTEEFEVSRVLSSGNITPVPSPNLRRTAFRKFSSSLGDLTYASKEQTQGSNPDFTDFDFKKIMEWVVRGPLSARAETPMNTGEQYFFYSSGGVDPAGSEHESPVKGFSSMSPLSHEERPSVKFQKGDDSFTVSHVSAIRRIVAHAGSPRIDRCLQLVENIVREITQLHNMEVLRSEKMLIELMDCLDNYLDKFIFSLIEEGGPSAEASSSTSTPSTTTTEMASSGSSSDDESPRSSGDEEDPFIRMIFLLVGPSMANTIHNLRIRWFLISRELRRSVLTSILTDPAGKVDHVSHWPNIVSISPFLVPFHVVPTLSGLSHFNEEFLVTKIPKDWTLYSSDYYVASGPRIIGQIKYVEESISLYVRDLVLKYEFPVATPQLESASHLTKLVNCPAFEIASRMPAKDVDPPMATWLSEHERFAISSLAFMQLYDSLKKIWPPSQQETKEMFGVGCLALRFTALMALPKSRIPVDDKWENSSVEALMPIMLPLFPDATLEQYKHCLERTLQTDMVALPMMMYHLLSEKRAEFEYETLYVLLKAYERINWTELDKAAKIRAATAMEKPNWWARWNSLGGDILPSLRDLMPSIPETGNAVLDMLMDKSLSDFSLVPNFLEAERAGLPKDLPTTNAQVRAAVAILNMVVGGIRASGDFRKFNQWSYVLSFYLDEYDELMKQSEPNLDSVQEFVNRAKAVKSVASMQPRTTSTEVDATLAGDFAPVLAQMFDSTNRINQEGFDVYFVHFIKNALYDAYLAQLTFERLIANLAAKVAPHPIES